MDNPTIAARRRKGGRGVNEAAPVGFKLVDRDLRVVRINVTLARIKGLSVADQIGHTVAEIAPTLWPRVEPIYRRALRGEPVCNVDLNSRARPIRCGCGTGSPVTTRCG